MDDPNENINLTDSDLNFLQSLDVDLLEKYNTDSDAIILEGSDCDIIRPPNRYIQKVDSMGKVFIDLTNESTENFSIKTPNEIREIISMGNSIVIKPALKLHPAVYNFLDLEMLEEVTGRPIKIKDKKDAKERTVNDVVEEKIDLVNYYHVSLRAASKVYGMPTSTLLKRWSEIKKRTEQWPHRQLVRLKKKIRNLYYNRNNITEENRIEVVNELLRFYTKPLLVTRFKLAIYKA